MSSVRARAAFFGGQANVYSSTLPAQNSYRTTGSLPVAARSEAVTAPVEKQHIVTASVEEQNIVASHSHLGVGRVFKGTYEARQVARKVVERYHQRREDIPVTLQSYMEQVEREEFHVTIPRLGVGPLFPGTYEQRQCVSIKTSFALYEQVTAKCEARFQEAKFKADIQASFEKVSARCKRRIARGRRTKQGVAKDITTVQTGPTPVSMGIGLLLCLVLFFVFRDVSAGSFILPRSTILRKPVAEITGTVGSTLHNVHPMHSGPRKSRALMLYAPVKEDTYKSFSLAQAVHDEVISNPFFSWIASSFVSLPLSASDARVVVAGCDSEVVNDFTAVQESHNSEWLFLTVKLTVLTVAGAIAMFSP